VAAPVLTFAVFSVIARNRGGHDTLDTARVFTSLSLFTLLSDPLQSLILTMATFMSSVGSFHRIQDFLERDIRTDERIKPELEQVFKNSVEYKSKTNTTDADIDHEKSPVTTLRDDTHQVFDQNVITVVDGAFGYDGKKPLLNEVNLIVPQNKLTMIVGPVGCGKSILLKALLGEMPTLSGSVHLTSVEIAFCDQTPWHMNGTVQQSIIGLSHLDEDWYRTVIEVCALDADLQQLARGDQTSIGSKGISLSGGQSQRIVSNSDLFRTLY
jgi:ATP-binding cassette subfamily C (CFTR/MRP) protein 1